MAMTWKMYVPEEWKTKRICISWLVGGIVIMGCAE